MQGRDVSLQAVQGRHGETEDAPDLLATTLAAGIAAGVLFYLVRVLLAV